MYSENRKKEKFGSINIKLLGGLFLLILVLFVVILWNRDSEDLSEMGEEMETVESIKGSVYFTVESEESKSSKIYKKHLSSSRMETVFRDSFYYDYMPNISSDGSQMVFVRSYSDETYNLVLFDMEKRDFREITPRGKDIPNHPLFSPDGTKIAYWSSNGNQKDLSGSPEDFEVYVFDLNRDEKKVSNGVSKLFSPDGDSLVILKNDGLYTLHLEDGVETLVIDWLFDESLADYINWFDLNFTFSEKQGLLFIVDDSSSMNYILEIESWSPFEYNVLSEEAFFGFGKVLLSPDDNYFAVLGEGESEVSPYQIDVFSLDDFGKEKSIDISKVYEEGVVNLILFNWNLD